MIRSAPQSQPVIKKRRFRVPRYTRIGKIFVGIALFVSIAAFNTGNNPLYLLFGMLLSLIGISSILPEWILRDIQVQRQVPPRIFAGQPVRMTLILTNLKRWLPCFSVVIADQIQALAPNEHPYVFFFRVPPQTTASATYSYTFLDRGIWTLDGFLVASSFPFELFQKRIGLNQPDQLLVYPTPVPPARLPFLGSLPQGNQPRSQVGTDGDFLGLRDHRPFESLRQVHWKSSAKRENLVVRELERQEAQALTLCFYNHWIPFPSQVPFEPEDQQQHHQWLEHGVAQCAGLAQYLINLGYPVALVTLDQTTPLGLGPSQLDLIWTVLAKLQFHRDPRTLSQTSWHLKPLDRCVVLAHGPQFPPTSPARTVAKIPFDRAKPAEVEVDQPGQLQEHPR